MIIRQEPKWLSKELVLMLHNESLSLFGGSPGIRDLGLLESALSRPLHRYSYEESVTLFELAAAYCHGNVKNHAFVDGNKRAALLSGRAFLFLNGFHFAPDQVETVKMIEGLAAGTINEPELASWLEKNSSPRP